MILGIALLLEIFNETEAPHQPPLLHSTDAIADCLTTLQTVLKKHSKIFPKDTDR